MSVPGQNDVDAFLQFAQEGAEARGLRATPVEISHLRNQIQHVLEDLKRLGLERKVIIDLSMSALESLREWQRKEEELNRELHL